jgi:DNA-binding PadR family transcriptional regulator
MRIQRPIGLFTCARRGWRKRSIATVAAATDDHLLIEEGPLYTALHRLEKKGWVAGEWGLSENNRRAKSYTLSPSGRRQLRAEVTAWERYAEVVSRPLAFTAPATA